METSHQKISQKFDQIIFDINMFYNSKVTRALIDNPKLLQAVDSNGFTLLHFASAAGNHYIILNLIRMGADVNAQDYNGDTPLSQALQKNRSWPIQFLLHANADIYKKNCNGQSILYTILHKKFLGLAVMKLFFDRVKKDCRTIEDVIRVMSSVNCPIYHATLWRSTTVIQSRLNEGWKVNARNPKNNETALHVAVRLSDLENVKLLLDKGANVNARDLKKRTPLSYLDVKNCSNTNLEIIRLLIARGAGLYKSDINGSMQISYILEQGFDIVVKVLLDHGVNLSKTDEAGNTAVHYLASNQNAGCIQELRGKTFDPNFKDDTIITPLQRAAIAGMPENIKFLLDRGANVNKANWNFMTPLFYAVMTNSSKRSEILMKNECLELLLQRGAEAVYINNEIYTVFEIILSFHNYRLSKPILMHLAVRELLGTPINKVILDQIHSNEYFKRHLDLYRRQLKEMQKITVFESVTLFEFIAGSNEKIEKYARNQKIVKRLVRMGTKYSSTSQCKRYLKKRVIKAIHKAQVNRCASIALGKILNLGGGGCYSGILESIGDYLNDTDVRYLFVASRL